MAKLEGNSLKFTALPPRNRCFSRLINRAACIPLIHLRTLSIEISAPCDCPIFLFLFLSLSFSFLFPRYDAKSSVSSPPQNFITDRDRYRSNVALPAIGIDRCSFSSMIIVGSMFHAILKLHYESLADLGAWGDIRIWRICRLSYAARRV